MTSQQFLVFDSSTVANFKSWAQPIDAFFATAGWQQSTDTGQVNWATISAVPGSGLYVYSIWKPNDGLANFFLKIEYGNISGVNNPSIRLTLSTTTDGAGTPTGFAVGPFITPAVIGLSPNVTQFECDFSGGPGRIHVLMWRNSPSQGPQMFTIERSLNGSGAYTSAHVTLATCCWAGNFANGYSQQTLLFGIGPAPAPANAANTFGGFPARLYGSGSKSNSSAFNGAIGFDNGAPYIGFWDWPLTGMGIAYQPDLVEGVPFAVTVYGSQRIYMPWKGGGAGQSGPFASACVLCMRYD